MLRQVPYEVAVGFVCLVEVDAEFGESLEDSSHGLDGISENDLLVRFALLVVVATVVNKLHLFQHCRLREAVRL